MKQQRKMVCSALTLMVLLVAACSDPVSGLKTRATSIADAINLRMVQVRASIDGMAASLEKGFADPALPTPNPESLDKSRGGNFALFESAAGSIYYDTNKEDASYYVSPGKNRSGQTMATLSRMIAQQGVLQKAQVELQDIIVVAFFGLGQSPSIAMLYPSFDVPSFYPPNLDFKLFPWFQRGLNSAGPAIWSPEPFVDLGTGWVMDIAKPVAVSATQKGVAIISLNLPKLSKLYITEIPDANVVLLGGDTTIVSMSPGARKLVGIKELGEVDFVRQMSSNSFAGEDYRLSGAKQGGELQAIAHKISAGESAFRLPLAGKERQFVVADIPEIGFHVLAFD